MTGETQQAGRKACRWSIRKRGTDGSKRGSVLLGNQWENSLKKSEDAG